MARYEEVSVSGYEEFIQAVKQHNGKTIFAYFSGSKDAERKSWCPDCVQGEAGIRVSCLEETPPFLAEAVAIEQGGEAEGVLLPSPAERSELSFVFSNPVPDSPIKSFPTPPRVLFYHSTQVILESSPLELLTSLISVLQETRGGFFSMSTNMSFVFLGSVVWGQIRT